MIINGLRWGGNRHETSCSSKRGMADVELAILDNGQKLFVSFRVCNGQGKIYVSRVTLFDTLINFSGMETCEETWECVRSDVIGEIELEEDGILRFANDDPLGKYWRAIHSARLCLQAYFNQDVTDNAEEFISCFYGRNVDECYIDLFEAAKRVDMCVDVDEMG